MSLHSRETLFWLAATVRKLDRLLSHLMEPVPAPTVLCLDRLLFSELRPGAPEFCPADAERAHPSEMGNSVVHDVLDQSVSEEDFAQLSGPWFSLPSIGTWLLPHPILASTSKSRTVSNDSQEPSAFRPNLREVVPDDPAPAWLTAVKINTVLAKVATMQSRPRDDQRDVIVLSLLSKLFSESLDALHAGRGSAAAELAERAFAMMNKLEL